MMADLQDDTSPKVLDNQVDTYSEFLNELARQRHTIIKDQVNTSATFTAYDEVTRQNDKMVDQIDALVRDTLRSIEKVTELVAVGREPDKYVANPPEATSNTDKGGKI